MAPHARRPQKIEDEHDPVRLELKQVLDRDDITIIPVLVEDAKSPKPGIDRGRGRRIKPSRA
jgi:hypothetical protein